VKRTPGPRLTRAALDAYARDARKAYEQALTDFVETPSVSADPARRADVAHMAEKAARLVRRVGGTARVVRTGGLPLVVGELRAGAGRPTLTLYNHLDVQPADREAEGWRTEP
jgi:acetylornithine deacetylase/succinyl-diaminopimelate desuccinylase-like protein